MRKAKLKGFTLVEMLVVIAIIAILGGGAVSGGTSYINKSKNARVIQDFDVLKTAASNMFYEYSGLGRIAPTEIYKYFNQYVDSTSFMNESCTELISKDPWDAPYKVRFTQVSTSETKLFFESAGKSVGEISYILLVHYKNGEVRVGTSGLNRDQGTETSDISVTSGGAVTLTNMWAK